MDLSGANGALQRLVLFFTRHYDYHALRAARVIAQNADYTLELKPEDDKWPGMSRVPIRFGLPGVQVRVKAGIRVLFTFEDGDPRRPIATEWDRFTGKVEPGEGYPVALDLRDGNGRAIACNGDLVMIPSLKGIPVQLFMPDPSGVGPPVPLTLTSPAGPVPVPPLTLRFLTPGFFATGQIVAVSPNKA